MNATCAPAATETRWKTPNSARQGAHQEAHLLITTGVPAQRRQARAQRGQPAGEQLARLRVQRGQRRRGAGQARLHLRGRQRRRRDGRRRGAAELERPTTSRTSDGERASASDRRFGVIAAKGGRCALTSIAPPRAISWSARQSRGAQSIRRRAPTGRHPFEPRRSRTSTAALSRSPEPLWPSPPQWPSRPRPFRLPPTSRARRSSCASASCTRARMPRSRSPGHAAPARARPGAGRARGGPEGEAPLDGLAARVLAAAGPRAAALRGGAQAGRRHRALRPPGRRALGHAHGAARGGAAAQRPERQRPRAPPRPSCSPRPTSSGPTRIRRRARTPPAAAEPSRRGRGGRGRGGATRTRTRRTTRTTTSAPSSAPRPRRRTTRTRTRTEPSRRSPRRRTRPRRARGRVRRGAARLGRRGGRGGSLAEQPEDPNAAKRFWFEHATGAGKTVAALGFVEASQTGGVLILTHRRNLVDQFNGELRDRGYSKRISRPLLKGEDSRQGPGDGRDLPVVRAQRRQDLERLHDRHLRRGPHRPGREDERGDPRLDGADLHRHDRHRAR